MNTLLVYDDCKVVSPELTTMIGVARFGDVVYRRQHLFHRVCSLVNRLGWGVYRADSAESLDHIEIHLLQKGYERVVHISSSLVPAEDSFALDRLERLGLVTDICHATLSGETILLLAASVDDYMKMAPWLNPGRLMGNTVHVPVDGAFVDVGNMTGLVDFLSGSFNSRYFNSVTLNKKQVVKYSKNIQKIKSEYNYFRLLPESMRRWFVMPYDLKNDSQGASYAMERLLVLDMGQQWVNGGFSTEDFDRFITDILHFADERSRRPCTREKATVNFDRLYIEKVRVRQESLQSDGLYAYLDDMLRSGTRHGSLQQLTECYLDLIAPYRYRLPDFETVGHGDLCFSNILYDKRIRLLKLIDPKGGCAVEELYTDPLYDYAKLSHSILGGYDFIVNGLYEVLIDDNLRLRLQTPDNDFHLFAKSYITALESRSIDVKLLRLCEASLFLSMLPLHREKPRNVLAFALIAVHILEEIMEQ